MSKKYIFPVLLILIALSGCQEKSDELSIQDLTESETIVLNRYITLERARSVAIVDSLTGTALLDSLNTAWGDSSLAKTIALLPQQPARLSAFHKLLVSVLDSEQDSLLLAPVAERLLQPLPDIESEKIP
ncbi:MAG: hypothetical protein GY752_08165 [bacterium]|nr:hypothetical protein [bacterium]MCP4799020.1 hypothetical protein [bacterium]